VWGGGGWVGGGVLCGVGGVVGGGGGWGLGGVGGVGGGKGDASALASNTEPSVRSEDHHDLQGILKKIQRRGKGRAGRGQEG